MKITAKKMTKNIMAGKFAWRFLAALMLSFSLVLVSVPVAAESGMVCGVHNECNPQQQCVVVGGAGSNQCQTAYDCLVTHSQCQNNQCVTVPGVGINQCQTEGDCAMQRHNECSNGQCLAVNGAGSNQCQTNGDCAVTHASCVNQACIAVAGVGISECQTDASCARPTHNICANQQCIQVDGQGPDQCWTGGDCMTQSHNECSFFQCRSVAGVGINQCGNGLDCIVPKHNICENRQCITVNGSGPDRCLADSDCAGVIVDAPPSDQPPFGNISIIGGIAEVLATPLVENSVTTLATAGAVVATAATATALFDINFSIAKMLLLPFGFTRRKKPWGVVYDSVTKRPLDPAYVTLNGSPDRENSSSVTDLDGRYGFMVPAGSYTLTAAKTHYAFPSQKLKGRASDELYSNLYFGGTIVGHGQEDVIMNNIPMDPVDFDWNEFAKKDKNLYSFYSKSDFVLRRISNVAFYGGLVFSAAALWADPSPYSATIFGSYVAFLGGRVVGIKPRPLGYVFDKKTGLPLSFAIVRVMVPGVNVQVAHAVTDKFGRYYCLVGKGSYYVKIESKNVDASYSLVYTSPIIDAGKAGIIKQKFGV